MTATHQLRNIFQLAADWQRMPSEIQAAAATLSITPAARYSGLALYSDEQQQAIAEHMAKQEGKAHA